MKKLVMILLVILAINPVSANLEIIGEGLEEVINLRKALDIFFTDLDDTPENYGGSAGECVRVNDAGTALEFVNCTNTTIYGYGYGDIFVNESGDTMTGELTVESNANITDNLTAGEIYLPYEGNINLKADDTTDNPSYEGNLIAWEAPDGTILAEIEYDQDSGSNLLYIGNIGTSGSTRIYAPDTILLDSGENEILTNLSSGLLASDGGFLDVDCSNDEIRLGNLSCINSSSLPYVVTETDPIFSSNLTNGFSEPIIALNGINSSDWTNVTITESQISDLQSYLTSETSWTANSTLVSYLAGNNVWTGENNFTGYFRIQADDAATLTGMVQTTTGIGVLAASPVMTFYADGIGVMDIADTYVKIDKPVNVGLDGTGHDYTFYGDTAGKKLLWDESADELVIDGNIDLNGDFNINGEITSDVGIGATPESTLHVEADSGDVFRVVQSGTGGAGFTKFINQRNSASNTGAGIIASSEDGALMANGDRLGFVLFAGSTGASKTDNSGGVTAFADGTWGSSSDTPSRIEFEVTTDGTTTRYVALTIKNDKSLVAPYTYDTTVGGTNRDLYIDNTGKIGYVSSSISTKENVENATGTDWLYDLRVVDFDYIDDSMGTEMTGLVAEEVENVNNKLVSYKVNRTYKCFDEEMGGNQSSEKCIITNITETNEPETVNYGSPILISTMIKETQNQKVLIESLQTQIDELKIALCRYHPQDRLCLGGVSP